MTYAIHDSATLPAISHTQDEDWIIARATEIIDRRIFQRLGAMYSPTDVKTFLRSRLATERNETFVALFLDTRHRVIAYEELFRGTIDQSVVYPRVVLAKALEHNAAAAIFGHNHPSGVMEPSRADKVLTERLKTVLGAVDIELLDHLIIGEGSPFSFAEAGLI